MKKVIIILTLMFFSFEGIAQSPEQKLLGNWYAEGLSKSTIHIYRDESGVIFGKIIKSEDPDKIGKIPINNFKYDQNKGMFIGRIKPVNKSFELDGEITLVNDTTIKMVGSKLFLTRTFMLKKV